MEESDNGEMVICFSLLGTEQRELVKASVKAREYAYTPYSHFKVGAAVRVQDGCIYTGCNVENSAYSGCICAERVAITKAVSEGHTKFSALAITGMFGSKKAFVFPCGICRQFVSEFASHKDIPIYLVKPDLKLVVVTSIRQLLPHSFAMKHT